MGDGVADVDTILELTEAAAVVNVMLAVDIEMKFASPIDDVEEVLLC